MFACEGEREERERSDDEAKRAKKERELTTECVLGNGVGTTTNLKPKTRPDHNRYAPPF